MTKVGWILAMVLVAGCGGSSKKAAAVPEPEEEVEAPSPDDEEPEEDDGVEIEGLLGTLDVADIQPVIDKRARELEGCYQDGVGKLRYVGGSVELKFRVAADGVVKWVKVQQGDLGAWPIEKCLLEIARTMKFPRPRGGEAEFTFPLEFPGRGRVVPLDDARADAEIGPRLAELDECVDEAGVPAPSQVQVTVYVAVGGRVTSAGFATVAEEPFADAWADCALERVLGWKLTDPRGKVWKAQTWYAQE